MRVRRFSEAWWTVEEQVKERAPTVSDAFWIAVVVSLGVTQARAGRAARGDEPRARTGRGGVHLDSGHARRIGARARDSRLLGIASGAAAAVRSSRPSPARSRVVTGSAAGRWPCAGFPAAYAVTGLPAVPYLLAASYLAPRIGVGLFLAALIAGQLGGGVLLDHFGALAPRRVRSMLARMLGVAALLVGVVLVRGVSLAKKEGRSRA